MCRALHPVALTGWVHGGSACRRLHEEHALHEPPDQLLKLFDVRVAGKVLHLDVVIDAHECPRITEHLEHGRMQSTQTHSVHSPLAHQCHGAGSWCLSFSPGGRGGEREKERKRERTRERESERESERSRGGFRFG